MHRRRDEISLNRNKLNQITPAAGDKTPAASANNAFNPKDFNSDGNEFYVRSHGVQNKIDGHDGESEIEQKIWLVQIGYDALNSETENGTLRIGPTLSLDGYKLKVEDSGTKVDMTSTSLAMTASYEASNGAYVDGILQGTIYSADVSNPGRGKIADVRGRSLGVSTETGIQFSLGNNVTVEPHAQLAYQRISFDNFTDDDGVDVEIGTSDSLRGRLGVKLEKNFVSNKPYVWSPLATLDLEHEFLDRGNITAGNVNFDSEFGGTAAKMGAGVNVQFSQTTEFLAKVSYGHALSDGAADSLSGTLRLRVIW